METTSQTSSSLLADQIPAPGTLLAQRCAFQPDWWIRRLPPGWADVLGQLPRRGELADPLNQRVTAPGYHTISRRDVLEIGAQGDPRTGLAAALAWGTGSRSHLIGRRARFATGDLEMIDQRLQAAHAILRDSGPGDAFQVLAGPGHIKYLGPALSSAFLYTMDSPGAAQCGAALILDGYMMLGLASLPGWPYRARSSITPTVYRTWLSWAHLVAQAATAAAGAEGCPPVRPDAVESAIYARGIQRASELVIDGTAREPEPGGPTALLSESDVAALLGGGRTTTPGALPAQTHPSAGAPAPPVETA